LVGVVDHKYGTIKGPLGLKLNLENLIQWLIDEIVVLSSFSLIFSVSCHVAHVSQA